MVFQKPDLEQIKNSENLKHHLKYLGIITIIIIGVAIGHNLYLPDKPVKVGYVEVYTECFGIKAGACIGIQKRTHKTFNYNNYTEVEPGAPNYYRRIESELMIRAYNTCNKNMSGYEWTKKVSYLNKTAKQWRQNPNVTLLPCEKTFYRPLVDKKQ